MLSGRIIRDQSILVFLFNSLFVLVVLVSLISVMMRKVFSVCAYIRLGLVVVYLDYDDLN